MCKSLVIKFACSHKALQKREPCSIANNGFGTCDNKISEVIPDTADCHRCIKGKREAKIKGWKTTAEAKTKIEKAKLLEQVPQLQTPPSGMPATTFDPMAGRLVVPFAKLRSELGMKLSKSMAAGSKRSNQTAPKKATSQTASKMIRSQTASKPKGSNPSFSKLSDYGLVSEPGRQSVGKPVKEVQSCTASKLKRTVSSIRRNNSDPALAQKSTKRPKTQSATIASKGRKAAPAPLKLQQQYTAFEKRGLLSAKTPKTEMIEHLQQVVARLDKQIRNLGYSPALLSARLSPIDVLRSVASILEHSNTPGNQTPRRSPRFIPASSKPALPNAISLATPLQVAEAVTEVKSIIAENDNMGSEITEEDLEAFEAAMFAGSESEISEEE